jgi:hypothetical protein
MGTDSEAASGMFEVNCGLNDMICVPKTVVSPLQED